MKHPNQCRILMDIIVMLGLVIAGLPLLLPAARAVMYLCIAVGGVLAGCGLLFGFFAVRCPFCSCLLPLKGGKTEYCPHCGEKLEI